MRRGGIAVNIAKAAGHSPQHASAMFFPHFVGDAYSR
jgi:hypothetical protein